MNCRSVRVAVQHCEYIVLGHDLADCVRIDVCNVHIDGLAMLYALGPRGGCDAYGLEVLFNQLVLNCVL